MALINTLREKMGKVVVGFIAVSISAFVLTDLLGPNSAILGGNDTTIGEIAGTSIKYQDFLDKLEEVSYNYSLNTGRSPNAQELTMLRQQTWDALINDIAYGDEYKKLGITVTNEEVIDMVQGNNIAPEIRQSFTNPETGVFDKDQVVGFLQNLANQPPQQQAAWYAFESNLGPSRTRSKYNNLLVNSNFATSLEGKAEYNNVSASAAINYLYVSYISVPDTDVEVTEAELKKYLADNADQYQREESRSINYIYVSMAPSAKDSAFIQEDLERLKASLNQPDVNDSLLARTNSDGFNPYRTVNIGQLPDVLKEDGQAIPQGTVVGPVLANGKYTLYKMSKVVEDGAPSAKASHILINFEDESDAAKTKAKTEATRILNEIKRGADFAEMARMYGTDGTASRGGDLGWFGAGQMVEPFENAVFEATKKGLLNNVVETQFGYHIIDVTEPKTTLSYSYAQIDRDIIISDETRDLAYRKADMFAASTGNLAEFSKNAEEFELEIKTVSKLDKNQSRIGTLNNARGIVIWAYANAKVGQVSEVFELDEGYVVAALTGNQDKGVARLEDVRNEVENKVKNKKKADFIISKLGDTSRPLDEIATAYGSGAKVQSMPDLKLSSNSLTGVGLAPDAVGVVFSMETGERTKPFGSESAVLIIEVESKTTPAELGAYEAYAGTIALRRQTRTQSAIDKAIREFADIEDKRYKFF